MKDFLTFEGIQNIIGSRNATRDAFNKGLIEEGQIWIDMIECRNENVHSYNKETADKIKQVYFLETTNFSKKMKPFSNGICTKSRNYR